MSELVKIDFMDYDIGKEYIRGNKKCIFDPIREKLIVSTPEEIVRQKMICFLIDRIKVPRQNILVEEPICHHAKGAKGRADIIVTNETDDGHYQILMVIECKAPNVFISDKVLVQADDYNIDLGADYAIATNGYDSVIYGWDIDKKEYKVYDSIPTYMGMINSSEYNFTYVSDLPMWSRPKYSPNPTQEVVDQFKNELYYIGKDSKESLYPYLINLAGFLKDETVTFPSHTYRGTKLIENGIRFTSFGNVSGGTWDGQYRYFVLEDESKTNHQIVSMSLFGVVNTHLVVAIDDLEKSHNSLQLNIDKNVITKNDTLYIYHSGALTLGNKGSMKRKEVIDFVKDRNPCLVTDDNKIFLGKINKDTEMKWEDKDTRALIENLIDYAIIRDEFRTYKRKHL